MANALIFSDVDIPANHSANFWVSIRIHQKYMHCATWRKISIALTDPASGEETAQSCAVTRRILLTDLFPPSLPEISARVQWLSDSHRSQRPRPHLRRAGLRRGTGQPSQSVRPKSRGLRLRLNGTDSRPRNQPPAQRTSHT